MNIQHHIAKFMSKTGIIARDIVMMFLALVGLVIAGFIVFYAGKALGCNERVWTALNQAESMPAFRVNYKMKFTEGAIDKAMREKYGVGINE